jgi:DNA-directed RNA polymerase specialized sigma subunit
LSMEFVRYHETETLLKRFKELQGMSEVLRAQVQSVMAVNEGEVIESLVFFRNADGLPKSEGTVSDRTGNIAAGLRKSNIEISDAIKEIAADLLLLDTTIQKLEIGLRVLLPNERKAVELKYFQGLNWYEIADEMSSSVATAQRHRKAGVERIRVVSRITVDDYNRIMRILNLN